MRRWVRVGALVAVLGGVGLARPVLADSGIVTTTFRTPLFRPSWCDSHGCASWDYYGNVVLDAEVQPSTTSTSLATGTITFSADGQVLGTVPVSSTGYPDSVTGANDDVRGRLVTAALAVGAHTITAAYSGDDQRQPSTSSPWSVTVRANPTQTTVETPSPNPSEVDEPPTVPVSVVPYWGGVATGSVTLLDDSKPIGVAQLDANGSSEFRPTLSAGVHHLTATYSPDGGFGTSSAGSVDQTVLRLTTAITADA